MSQSVFILYLLVPTLQRIYMQLTLSELFKRRTKWKYAIEFLCSILFHFCVLTMTYFQSLKTLLIKYCGLEQCLATVLSCDGFHEVEEVSREFCKCTFLI